METPDTRSVLYNPDEEPHGWTFNDVYVEIPARGSIDTNSYHDLLGSREDVAGAKSRLTHLAKTIKDHGAFSIAAHIAEKLKRFGVILLSAPARDGKAASLEEQEAVDAAEEACALNRRGMCETLLMDHHKAGESHKAAGLEWPDTEPVRKAREWLNKARG